MTLRSIIVAAEAIVAVCLSDTVVYYERTVWLMVFLYEVHEKDPRIGDVTFVHYRRHVIPTVQTTVTFLCSRPVRA